MKKIAILMCSFNRVNKTVKAIDEIYSQKIDMSFEIDIYLTDDGSSDGTKEEVFKKFPDVNIISGDGTFYWNGGMRAAYEKAKKLNYDFYIWLNDDTFIYEETLSQLFYTYNQVEEWLGAGPKIIVGTTKDSSERISYGGVTVKSKLKPVNFKLIETIHKKPIECDTFNGNIVLIDKAVYKLVGNLDTAFIHGMGDFDFGLRAKKMDVRIFIAPGILGVCEKNSIEGTYKDPSLSIKEGVKKLLSIKGLPLRQWYVFTKRHAGLLWLLFFSKPYIEYIPKMIMEKYLKRK